VRRLVAAVLFVAVAGCAHYGAEFVPAYVTQPGAADEHTGVSTEAGVTVAVSGRRWSGDPSELGAIVTPMYVTIFNNSGEALRLSYGQFELVGPTGVRMQAVSPYSIQRPGAAGYGPYGGWAGGFYWGGWPGPYWYGPWGYGGYWAPYYYYWEPLPSRDMLRRALPQGELASGGTVSGWVDFPYVGEDGGQVRFRAKVISADTNQPLAAIEIPFVAKG